ncbi:MAG: ribonuclease HII [Thiobacillaceae bacterium]|jgi:ribonuclease HII
MNTQEILRCGVDEAGRGPLAGPVYAAAVILDPERPIAGLQDSKKLSRRKRESLEIHIKENALAWCVADSSVWEIDTLNILKATLMAMQRAVEGLQVSPDHAQVDGNCCPPLSCSVESIVKGDATVAAISAASILAKTARDRAMTSLHREFPDYGFDQHFGYGTAKHLAALRRYGPCGAHRRSFSPVRELLMGCQSGGQQRFF